MSDVDSFDRINGDGNQQGHREHGAPDEPMGIPCTSHRVSHRESGNAYEFKVSGKNAWPNFIKDIVKVIICNEKRKKKIARLVCDTEVFSRCADGSRVHQVSGGTWTKSECAVCPARLMGS
jgi:hypothetical protein